MNKIRKIGSLFIVSVMAAVILTACAGTDVVLKYSPGSFGTIVKEFPGLITDQTLDDHYYYLTVDGETTLKISHDYDLTGSEDIVIQTPAAPFAAAGLDLSNLGEGYRTDGEMLYLTADYGKGTGTKDTVTDSLFESAKADRTGLTYHQLLDHYGIKLLKGKFEFAKDYTTNDKDLVFVIAAKPLAEMGVDVQNIDGWLFKTMKDTDGSDIDLLLKPYDLK